MHIAPPASMSLRSKAGSALTIVREHGLPGAAFVAGRVLLHQPWGRVEWFAILETTHDPGAETMAYRWITRPADAPRLVGLHGHIDDHTERLAAGIRAATVVDPVADDRVLAYLWVADGADHWDEDGVRIALGPSEAWAVDGFVARPARGRAIHSRMFMGVMDELHARGVTTIVSGVDLVNTASLRSAAKRRARRTATVMTVRLGPLALSSVRSADRGWTRRWRLGRTPVHLR